MTRTPGCRHRSIWIPLPPGSSEPGTHPIGPPSLRPQAGSRSPRATSEPCPQRCRPWHAQPIGGSLVGCEGGDPGTGGLVKLVVPRTGGDRPGGAVDPFTVRRDGLSPGSPWLFLGSRRPFSGSSPVRIPEACRRESLCSDTAAMDPRTTGQFHRWFANPRLPSTFGGTLPGGASAWI